MKMETKRGNSPIWQGFVVGEQNETRKIVQNEHEKGDIEHGFLLSMDMLGEKRRSVLFKQESMKVRFFENYGIEPTFTFCTRKNNMLIERNKTEKRGGASLLYEHFYEKLKKSEWIVERRITENCRTTC